MAVEVEQHQLTGLTPEQVERSRALHGSNVLTPPTREPWWKLYLAKFEDPVIRILIIAAVVTIAVGAVDGHFAEGVGIVIAILLSTALGFVNEYRATREFDVLNQANDDLPIDVIRSGAYTTVPRRDLVVDDLVLIEEGDEAPADGQLIEAVSLQINESILTGESLPVSKFHHGADFEQPAGDAFPLDSVFRGTAVVDGRGTMRVTAVGDATRIGEIARVASSETGEVTPLNAQLDRLSKLIGVIGFTIAALTFLSLVAHEAAIGELVLTGPQWLFSALLAVGVLIALNRVWLPIAFDALDLMGRPRAMPDWLENGGLSGWLKSVAIGAGVFAAGLIVSIVLGLIAPTPSSWLPAEGAAAFLRFFTIAVTIIVVAVPEGLPMSVTLSLAYSMRKMTASNNLVRHMHACETIGAATVICSDKTGTLTLNEMRVHDIDFPSLGGGALTHDLNTLAEQLIVESIAVNTTANLSRVPGEVVRPLGDSTEGALLLWLEGKGLDYVVYRSNFSVKYQLTFSSERKFMGTLGLSCFTRDDVLYIKGAPEVVLDQCAEVLTEDGIKPLVDLRPGIEDSLRSYQRRGMRALGFAYQTILDSEDTDITNTATKLIWLGFVAIADPIRPEVPAAIQACRDAGIQVKLVTGDNPETAREIARQIGLWQNGDEAIPGTHLIANEFSSLDDEHARADVSNLKVLSRARPLDKLRLVQTLQANGEVVAVTGDGTNDAPALNFANVGLAMGTGTDIAKEASDIVLLDDSFRSIVNAVMWGRSLYENIQRFILFQLTINVAALGIALLGPFIGVEFPLTVIQMLWVNLIMDTFASLALATEPPHWEVMKHPPRKPSDFIISPSMTRGIVGYGAAFIVVLVGFLLYVQRDGVVTPHELSLFYSVFVLLQLWNLFNARTLGRVKSAFSGLFENKAFLGIAAVILIGQVLIVQFGGDIFRTMPLSLGDWITVIASTSVVLWVGEAWRYLQRRKLAQAA